MMMLRTILFLPCLQWSRTKGKAECIHVCKGHTQSVDTVAVDASKTKVSKVPELLVLHL